jgi:hypothetical protein
MNIVEHAIEHVKLVFESLISYDIPTKLVPTRPIEIVIPLNISNNIYWRNFSNMK